MIGMLFAGVLAMTVGNGAGRAIPQTFRLFLLSLAAGLSGYVLVGLEWLQIQNLPGLMVVPPEWRTAMVSTLFALTPLVWAVWDRRQREL
ncbi:MAG: hypothetical protein D6791_08470 [Chloroflexi bacterium]|nr:MAG: hypothetical protein D6791_08470 [Chloroflexota bacterium]